MIFYNHMESIRGRQVSLAACLELIKYGWHMKDDGVQYMLMCRWTGWQHIPLYPKMAIISGSVMPSKYSKWFRRMRWGSTFAPKRLAL